MVVPNYRLETSNPILPEAQTDPLQVILTFDVEEHYRIEAAAGLAIDDGQKAYYGARLVPPTLWLLDQLEEAGVRATFFVVGEIAGKYPGLVRAIHRRGHEIASHGWDHRMVSRMTPEEFRRDVAQSKDALEQLTGQAVLGYRAPTFSITRANPWAIDVLAESGMAYDSSIYPVRHDRYGVAGAPRGPFRAHGRDGAILELPPATLRLLGMNTPMGGGGYFRLFPLLFTQWALRQMRRRCRPAVATLYFHPWEFDCAQARLPLGRIKRFRTYVGIARTRDRLRSVLQRYQFVRAIDLSRQLGPQEMSLPSFDLADQKALQARTEGLRQPVLSKFP